MNNSTMTPNRSLNQIISDGDASSFVLKYKNALIALVLLTVASIIGYALYADRTSQNLSEYSTKIYTFENDTIKTFEQNNDAKNLVVAFKNLHSSVGNTHLLLPVAIKTSDLLSNKGHLNEALEILNLVKNFTKNEYAKYFLLTRLAAVYEDLGEVQKALDTLDIISSQSVKMFEGKTYLDLGRLYLKKGDKQKAKTSFQYVVDKAKEDAEFVKLAKIYLSKI